MSEVPANWVATSFGELGHLHCGQSPAARDVNQEGIGTPYVTGPEQWDGKAFRHPKWTTTPKRIVPDGCVFITVKGAGVGKTFPGVACAIGRDVYAFQPSAELDFEFILRAIQNRAVEIISDARGDIPGLSKSHIEDHQAWVPPLPEQRRIVAKLDRLSARSAAARDHLARTTKLATRAKQAILSAALSGELTRSWRDAGAGDGWTDGQIDEIEAQRAAYAKSRRGSRLESDSGLSLGDLGTLPDSWFPCHLAEIANIQVGHAFKSAWFTADGPLLVRGANVAPGALSWEDTKRLDPDRAPEFEKFRLDEGDIVLAMDRPLISTGLKIARVDAASAGALLVQRVARITGRSQADLSYLWHVLNSRIFIRHAIERATGGDLPHISGNDILTTPVPLPPLDEQREIVLRIESAFTRIDRLTEEASRAAHLLDRLDERLLAKAFRGELVPQDPEDEPAEALLTRIREARAADPKAKRGRRKAN